LYRAGGAAARPAGLSEIALTSQGRPACYHRRRLSTAAVPAGLKGGAPPLRRDLRLSLTDAVFFSVMVGVGETYLTPFALAIGMGEVSAGLVATLPMVAGGALQLVAPSALRLARSYRAWTVAWVALQALAFVPLIAAAWAGGAPAALVFAAASLYWGAGMAAAPAWNAWMSALIPVRIRSRYFARRQGAAQLGIVVGLLGGGAVLALAQRSGAGLAGFAALFVVALICRAVSAGLIAAQSLPPGSPRPTAIDLHDIVRRAYRSPQRNVIVCLVLVTAAVSLGGAFLPPYLLVESGMSYGVYTATLACFFLGKVASYRVLGRISRRLNIRVLLLIGGLGITPLPLLWLVSTDPWFFAACQLLSGVSWAAFELGTILSFLDVPDETERTSLLSAYYALNSLAAALASLLGGALLGAYGAGHTGYLVLFVACAAARLVALVALLYRARNEAVRVIPAIRTLAVRPWGGGVIRPVLATLGLGRERPAEGAPRPAAADDDEAA
jgi:MFS family permease